MNKSKLHLIAPAGSCRPLLEALGLKSAAELIALIQNSVGGKYEVSGSERLIEAGEDEQHGGRTDDRHRADDLQEVLGDDEVVAIILLRGGAWFTRVLPLIDFSVLDRRALPVAIFGFSELTTLVNIVGSHPRGLGIYDMGPAFLTYGLRRYGGLNSAVAGKPQHTPASWMRERLGPEFEAFFRDVIAIIEGRGTARPITAQLVRGQLPERTSASFVGGNLTVLSTLVGSPFDDCVNPRNRWLILEDLNEKVERIDRFLAQLTLAGYWERCEGVLLGDFHKGYDEQTPAVLELLKCHLPDAPNIPVLTTRQVGHIWPMSPLPLHVDLAIQRTDDDGSIISWPASTLQTVDLPILSRHSTSR